MRMEQLTDRLPNIIAIYDDISIFSSTPQEHHQNLLRLMKTAEYNGLVFNNKKCTIQPSQITFYSAVFTQHGMTLNPAKVPTLQDLPKHINQKELQSFLGLINYLQPYILDPSN